MLTPSTDARQAMTIAAYDTIAEWYDHWLGAGAVSASLDPYFSAAEALVGDLDGRLVCDLGCGQGRVARRLTERGARVVGIDVSARLLQIARRHEADTPGRVSYVRADASRLDCIAPDVFDGIVCYMALMDIEDLGSTVQHVRRVLRPGGWFLFTILHPCYNPGRSGELTTPEGLVRTVAGYFEEG